jgi:hypothetical protein
MEAPSCGGIHGPDYIIETFNSPFPLRSVSIPMCRGEPRPIEARPGIADGRGLRSAFSADNNSMDRRKGGTLFVAAVSSPKVAAAAINTDQ